MEDMFYVIHTSKGLRVQSITHMMFIDPADVWFSGTESQCQDFIQSAYSNDNEEMQELDPRDYERLDDYGDPCG